MREEITVPARFPFQPVGNVINAIFEQQDLHAAGIIAFKCSLKLDRRRQMDVSVGDIERGFDTPVSLRPLRCDLIQYFIDMPGLLGLHALVSHW